MVPGYRRLLATASIGFAVIFGAGATVAYLSHEQFVDGYHDLRVAGSFLAGGPIYDGWYYYSPLAVVLTAPFTALDPVAAMVLWTAVKLAALIALVLVATRGADPLARAAAVLVVVTFLPVLHDMALGNVNVILLVVVGIVAFSRDRPASGVPLGLAAAAIMKPLLVPFLVWMLFRRRRALAAAALTAVVATVVTAVLLGPARYGEYLAALSGAASFSGSTWDVALGWPAFAVVGVASFVVATVLAIRAGEAASIPAAAGAAVLVSPYLGLYGGVPLALAVLVGVREPSGWWALLAGPAAVTVLVGLPWVAVGLIAACVSVAPRAGRAAIAETGI